MIMKKIIIGSAICISALILASCSKDFLNTRSTSSTDESTLFSTTTTAKMAMEGLNRHMTYFDGTSPHMGYGLVMLWNEVLGEDLVYTKKNAQFTTQAKWELHRNTTSSHNKYCYRWVYEMMMGANTIIRNMDGSTITGPQGEKDFLKAQALTYRAFVTFVGAQWWGKRYDYGQGGDNNEANSGIVIRTENTGEEKARSTVAEVYQQINSDLDEAISLFEKNPDIVRSAKYEIDLVVALGIKARVKLAQGEWKNAADVAARAIKESSASLSNTTWEKKVGRGCDATNSEWIWGLLGSVAPDIHKYGQFYSFISNTNVSYNQNTPRAIYNKLYDRIPDTDSRKGLWLKEPALEKKTNIVYPPSGNLFPWMSQKYIVCAIDNTSKDYDGSKLAADIPWMRLPELYLIVAEGYARAGEEDIAKNHLNMMAQTRDPKFNCSALSGEALIDEIMFQRRIELWGEGFRFTDLKRLNMPLDRGPKPREGYNQGGWQSGKRLPANLDPEASNYNMYDAQEIGEENRYKEAGIKEWQFVIPQAEIDNNKLCTQNTI